MKNTFTLILLCITTQLFAQTSDSSQYFFQKGLDEKAIKRWLVASKHFDRAIALNPRFTAAYLENANVNLEMRKTDAAKKHFSKVYELDPGNAAAGAALMDLYFSYHQYQEAIDFAKKCMNCPTANRITALSYFQLEDYNMAEVLLLKLAKANPTDAELVYTLGRTYLEMQLEAKAIPYYVKALQLEPSKANWHFELGILYYNRGDYKNAVVYFNKATENGFNKSLGFDENLGYAYIFSGEFEKGEKLLLNVMEKKRGNKEMLLELAQIYYDHKMYDRSLDFCQKLIELNMKDGKAVYLAGLCFQKKGQKERGQQMCDKAIELDPSLNALRQKKMEMGL